MTEFEDKKSKYIKECVGKDETKSGKSINPLKDGQNVKIAYITFRHMDGFEHVMDEYHNYKSYWRRLWVLKKCNCFRKS